MTVAFADWMTVVDELMGTLELVPRAGNGRYVAFFDAIC